MTTQAGNVEVIVYSETDDVVGELNDYLELSGESRRGQLATMEAVLSGYDPLVPFLMDFRHNGCWLRTTLSGLREDWDPQSALVSVSDGKHICTINFVEREGS